jgi:hypothetical protein
MRALSKTLGIVALASMFAVSANTARAAEAALGSYGLGGSAFGAGVTPPAGIYVTAVTGYYEADIGGTIPFHSVVLHAGAKIEFFSSALNLLYVPERKVFGGNLGLSVTVPVGYVDIRADVGIPPLPTVHREVDGWGLGDIVPRMQLGWDNGALSHTVWIQGVTPTGRYSPSFSPSVGLNRPGIDTGVAATYTHKRSGLQFNGAVGVTFNFENEATDYKTGKEFHFEWAVAYELSHGLLVGIAGYDYRQLTGDSGSGAVLGSFKSRVDAIGPALSYSTMIGKTPFVFDVRYYREFNAEHRFEGSQTMASGTIRF